MAWNPKNDPIVRVNTATGERYTRNGLVISSSGNVVGGRKPPAPSAGVSKYTVTQPKGTPASAPTPRDTSHDVLIYDTSKQGLTNRKTRIVKMDASHQQQWLKSLGFNVDVDGIEGPQTKMARKAFLNGVSPSYWNKVWEKNHSKSPSPAGAASPTVAPGSTIQTTTSTPAQTPATASGAQVTASAAAPQGAPAAAPAVPTVPTVQAPRLPILDPQAYATGAANAEYNPQIQGFLDAIGYNRRAGDQAVQDVQGWNRQVQDTFNRYGALTQKAYGQAATGIGQDAAQVAQLFGGETGAQAQAYAQPAQDLVRTLAAGDQSFQNNMQAVFAQANADLARRARREFDNNIAQAQSGLRQAQTAKGQARSKYLFEGQQAKQQGIIAQQNADTAAQALAAAKATLPYDVQKAKAQAAAAAASAKAAGIEAGTAKATANYNAKLKQLQIKTATAQLDKLKEKQAAPDGRVDLSDAQTVTNFQQGLLAGATGKKGGLVIRPDVAWANIQDVVKNYTFKDPKKAQTIAKRAFTAALRNSHSKGQWSRWQWSRDGTKLVLMPAPKKK